MGSSGITGLRGWQPPPTREPDLGNASGGTSGPRPSWPGGRVAARRRGGRRRRPAERLRADPPAAPAPDHRRRFGLRPCPPARAARSISSSATSTRSRPAASPTPKPVAITIERHRPTRTSTDTELADRLRRRPGHVHIIGVSGGGDRRDDGGAPPGLRRGGAARATTSACWWERARCHVVRAGAPRGRGRRRLAVSLLPCTATQKESAPPALVYPLHGERLPQEPAGASATSWRPRPPRSASSQAPCSSWQPDALPVPTSPPRRPSIRGTPSDDP